MELFKWIDNLDNIDSLIRLREYLRKNPNDIVAINKDGFTPFTYALTYKDLNTFRILYNCFIQNKMTFRDNIINLQDANKNRPIDIVVNLESSSDRFQKLEFLIDNTDIDINLRDKFGNTPLQTLTQKMDDKSIELIQYSNKLLKNTNDCDFSQPNGFENCVYKHFCQCYEQCVGLSENFPAKQDICTAIIPDNNVDYKYYEQLIKKAIEYFKSKQLLIQSGIRYYILSEDKTKLKLSWSNIKTLENEETKKLFWLLRKLIVDSILKHLVKKYKLTLKIYSVGSAKITSDYDITLYGETDDKVTIIKSFQKKFKKLFGEDSSIVFDTNIYGKAYITFDEGEYLGYTDKAICGQTFYYLKENPSQVSQLMWGIVKYLRDLKESFGEQMYSDLFEFMYSKLPNFKILKYAHKTLISLSNKNQNKINYISLFQKEESFIQKYSPNDKLVAIHDFISLINFYGTETYFTRGAFMDTVVISQMCENRITIPLTEVDYITSILENTGFFFIHNNKTKYLIRVLNTFKTLIDKFNHYQSIRDRFDQLKSELNKIGTEIIKNGKTQIDYDIKYCHDWADTSETEVHLLKCQKYELFNILMNIIFGVLKNYHEYHPETDDIHFYKTFIIKTSSELGEYNILPSPIQTTFSNKF